jgi:hypothetical protein
MIIYKDNFFIDILLISISCYFYYYEQFGHVQIFNNFQTVVMP